MTHRFLLYMCFLLWAVVACEQPKSVNKAETAALYLSQGLQLARDGAHDKAVVVFEQGLQQVPDDLRLLYNQAVAYSELGDLEHEKALYLRALEVMPNSNKDADEAFIAAVHYNLAIVMLKQGDEAAAYVHFDNALSSLGDVNDYYHSMVEDRELDKIRDTPRFIIMMRQYWPEYKKMVGVHPASSREAIRQKEADLMRAYDKSVASP